MKAAFVTILFMALSSQELFAHGMNKPGPNNGYIKMPGAYHIELVTAPDNLKVYFHDVSFNKLAVTKSSAAVTLKGLKVKKLQCVKEADFYQCDTKNIDLKNYKEVIVETSQKGERVASSKYTLPLSY